MMMKSTIYISYCLSAHYRRAVTFGRKFTRFDDTQIGEGLQGTVLR